MTGGWPARVYAVGRGLLPETPLERLAVLVLALSSLYVALVDPFGLSIRSETVADAVVQQFAAGRAATPAAGRIALLLTDEDSYRRGELSYPLSYPEQAALVDFAAASGARAVFLDFTYARRSVPADLATLVRAVAAAERGGVPVFTGPIAPGRADLAPLAAAVRQTGVATGAAHPADYPLVGSDGRPNAALDLFRATCRRDPTTGAGCGDAPIRPGVAALLFGGTHGDDQARFLRGEDRVRCARGTGLLPDLRRGLRGDAPADPCPAYLVVPAGAVLEGRDTEAAIAALHGRVVMIGVGLGLGDDKIVPGVGRIPGVVLHATALDNLLTSGGRYLRWPADHFGQAGWDDLIKLLAVLVAPSALALFVGLRDGSPHLAGETLAALLLFALAMPVLALVGWMWGRWTPSVALVTAALALTFGPLLTHRVLGAPLAPLTGSRTVAGGIAAVLALLALLPFAPIVAGALFIVLAIAAAWTWRARRRAGRTLLSRETTA